MLSDVMKACVVIVCFVCVKVYLIDMTFGELAAMHTLGDCLLSLLLFYYFRYFGISDDVWKKLNFGLFNTGLCTKQQTTIC